MEFGKVHDLSQINEINWSLPPEDPLTSRVLKNMSSKSTSLWIGAPAWNHKEWLGRIYPQKTKPQDYLKYYSRYFNTIELNTTHYRIPTSDQTIKWLEKVEGHFLFCPKIFQGISHERSGLTDREMLHMWFQFIENLGNHAGPSFLQLPPHFDYSHKALLFKFLLLWPPHLRLALEFRHPSWFQNGVVLPALVEYLQTRKIGLVMTDVAGRRDVLHSSISAPFTMIRFIGNELHPSDMIRAKLWNDRLENWSNRGLQEVFFFTHEPDDILVPDLVEKLKTFSFFSENYPLSGDTTRSLDLSHPGETLKLL
jgi:uncharacterized protein YecE (DUF72 family)